MGLSLSSSGFLCGGFRENKKNELTLLNDLLLETYGVRSKDINLKTMKTSVSSSTILLDAVADGREDLVKCLLRHPSIEVNLFWQCCFAENEYGNGPALVNAAQLGEVGIVRLLLHQPLIDVNACRNVWTGEHTSALFEACLSEHFEVVELLLSHPRIDVNTLSSYTTDQIYSPLMCACASGNLEIVTLLLSHPDIDINLIAPSDDSALALAVRGEHPDCVALLLRCPGIDVNAV